MPEPSDLGGTGGTANGFLYGDRRVGPGLAPSPVRDSRPSSRSWAMLAPSMIRAQALANGTAVAFETKGTVRLARGLASRNIEHVILQGVLHIEQSDHPDPVRDSLGGPPHRLDIAADPA